MKKNKKNEELQSRRAFFKKAAKGALPILAAAVLAGAPSILKAAEKTPSGCNYGCSYSCYQRCANNCDNSCRNSCAGRCAQGCDATCRVNCFTACQGLGRMGY